MKELEIIETTDQDIWHIKAKFKPANYVYSTYDNMILKKTNAEYEQMLTERSEYNRRNAEYADSIERGEIIINIIAILILLGLLVYVIKITN